MDGPRERELLGLAGYEPEEALPRVSRAGATAARGGFANRDDLAGILEDVLAQLLAAGRSAVTLLPEFAVRDLRVFSPEEEVIPILAWMDEQDYSQVIVRDLAGLRLLTFPAIARWLMEQGPLADRAEPATIKSVPAIDDEGTYLVMAGDRTVQDAFSAFSRLPRLVAIILTEDGNAGDAPRGIVTPWDLLEYASGEAGE